MSLSMSCRVSKAISWSCDLEAAELKVTADFHFHASIRRDLEDSSPCRRYPLSIRKSRSPTNRKLNLQCITCLWANYDSLSPGQIVLELEMVAPD